MFLAMIDFATTAPETTLARLLPYARAARDRPGNIDFRVFQDAAMPGRIALLHRWQDRSAFEAYAADPAFAELGAAIRPLMSAPPVSLRLLATPVETLAG